MNIEVGCHILSKYVGGVCQKELRAPVLKLNWILYSSRGVENLVDVYIFI